MLALILLIGSPLTYYVVHSEDTEMRDHLITYVNTIERSIDWRPFENVLNTNPNNVTLADLSGMSVQLDDACRANRDYHFIILLSNLSSELQAITMAEKVVKVLAEPFQVAGKSFKIDISVGVALYPEHDTNEKNQIRHADNAMYVAKG